MCKRCDTYYYLDVSTVYLMSRLFRRNFARFQESRDLKTEKVDPGQKINTFSVSLIFSIHSLCECIVYAFSPLKAQEMV